MSDDDDDGEWDDDLCPMCDGDGGWDSEDGEWWEECPKCDGTGEP